MQQRSTPPTSPTIRNQVDKPQGALPRKTQQYIILGIATLIVLIALFSSHGGTKAHATQAANASDPAAPSASEISTYEQQLQQLQQAAQGGAKPAAEMGGNAGLREQQLAMQGALPTQPSTPPAPNPIQQQEQTLAYESLFASNIALSYGHTDASNSKPETSATPAEATTHKVAIPPRAGSGFKLRAPRRLDPAHGSAESPERRLCRPGRMHGDERCLFL